MNKTASISIGAILTGALTWLAHNFHVTGTTELGQQILTVACAIVGYIAGANIHKNGTATPGGPTITRAWLVPLVGLLALTAAPLHAQGTPAAIDSAQRHALELGTDLRMRSDSVTEPVRVRVGLALGPRITVEYTASASRAPEGYFEAILSLGLTAALTPGTSRFNGAYVAPSVLYHYDGGPAQLGVGLELGKRMQVGPNVIVRAFTFMDDYFRTRRLPTITSAGVGAGGSFGL